MTAPNLARAPICDNSLTFGESLSKIARHELAALCLRALGDELSRKPIPNKSRGRGRPPSLIGVLALRMEVHPDSVRRWMDLREIQASDYNSEKLAVMAVKFSPGGVARILQEDLDRYRETMAGWLKRVAPNNTVSPYAENTEDEEDLGYV